MHGRGRDESVLRLRLRSSYQASCRVLPRNAVFESPSTTKRNRVRFGSRIGRSTMRPLISTAWPSIAGGSCASSARSAAACTGRTRAAAFQRSGRFHPRTTRDAGDDGEHRAPDRRERGSNRLATQPASNANAVAGPNGNGCQRAFARRSDGNARRGLGDRDGHAGSVPTSLGGMDQRVARVRMRIVRLQRCITESPQHRIDPGLITGTLRLEPVEYVLFQAQEIAVCAARVSGRGVPLHARCGGCRLPGVRRSCASVSIWSAPAHSWTESK